METYRVIIKYDATENLWYIEDEQMGYTHVLLTFDTLVINELASELENPKEDGCCLFVSEKESDNSFRFVWMRGEPRGEVYWFQKMRTSLVLSREFMRLWEETPRVLYLETFYF
jgi:hypothetical protein